MLTRGLPNYLFGVYPFEIAAEIQVSRITTSYVVRHAGAAGCPGTVAAAVQSSRSLCSSSNLSSCVLPPPLASMLASFGWVYGNSSRAAAFTSSNGASGLRITEMKNDIGSVRSTFICSRALRWACVTLFGVPAFLPPDFLRPLVQDVLLIAIFVYSLYLPSMTRDFMMEFTRRRWGSSTGCRRPKQYTSASDALGFSGGSGSFNGGS
jgi:hypothetical protein